MSIIQVNTIRSKSGSSAPTCDQGLVVSGITTLGTVRVSTGIVTATSGVVTYFGDGQYLQNVGVAVTLVPNDLRITGVTTINSQLHVGSGVTINAQGLRASGIVTALSFNGSGRSLSGIVTQIVAGSNIIVQSSGSITGTGIVTISSFDDENYWKQTATGIHTTGNIGIGTTNSPHRLTVQGNANISGIVTSSGGFVGNLTGTSSNSTTSTIIPSNDNVGVHYILFADAFSGPEELRTDVNLNYSPDSDILNVGSLNTLNDILTPTISVGSGATVFIATEDGKVGISTATPTYTLEVGYSGLTGTTQYVHGDIESSQHIRVGADANITGVITATTYYGNGSGLVGVASTVQTQLIEFTESGVWSKDNYDFPINWVYVQCVGGGGSGNSRSTCSGGGAGGVVERLFRAKDLPINVSVIVGLGGTNSTSALGNLGGPSSFEVAVDNVVRAGGGGGARNINIGGGFGGDGDLLYASNFFVTSGATSSVAGGHGYSSSGGASGGTASISSRGGSSVIGPGAGGAGIAGIGGTSLRLGGSLGGIYASSMGKGGNGGTSSSLPTNGGFPGGGGGGNATAGSPSGAGGNGVVRVWAW
jgi:hypothetical protein